MRNSRFITHLTLAASVALLAACGGSDSSSESRQRNAIIDSSEPVYYPIDTGFAPDRVVVNSKSEAFFMSTKSPDILKMDAQGTIMSPWVTLPENAIDIAIDSDDNVFAMYGSAESTLKKFSPDGVEVLSMTATGTPLERFALASNDLAYGSSKESGFLTSFDLVEKVVTLLATEVGTGVTRLAGSADKIATLKSEFNNVIVWSVSTGMISVTVCGGATDIEVSSTGKTYVLCGQDNTLMVIDNVGVTQTVPLDVTNPVAMDVTSYNDIYVLSTTSNRVFFIDSNFAISFGFKVEDGANDIAANTKGDFFVSHSTSAATFWGSASTGGGTLEQDSIQPATYGPVTRLADGFSAQITNYSPDNTYSVSVPVASGEIFSVGSDYFVKVSGLNPGQSATAFVTTTRDKENTGSDISGSALEVAQTPMFGEVTRTEDGFVVDIVNYDPDFTYTASSSNPAASVAIVDGRLQVTGLSPDESASVDVTTSRSGYLDGTSNVTGTALEASAPAIDNAPPSDDSTSTSSTSTTTTSDIDATSTTLGDSSISTTTTIATQPEPATVIASGGTEVVAVPPAAIEKAAQAASSDSSPAGVSVPAGTTEITCDDACIDALLSSVGATAGQVSASVGGAPAVELAKGTATKLQIGNKDTSIDFTVTPESGEETVVNVPVVQSAGAATEADSGANGGMSPLWWIVLMILVLVLLLLAVLRRRSDDK
jgi:hypothetical protein